jgi:hypothetical protein
MATTDSNGIVFLEETDPISPFHTTMNVLQQGTSDALTGLKDGSDEIIVIHRVANTTERATLAASYSPTSAKPLFVWRADATGGRELEYTNDGTNWFSAIKSPAVSARTTTNMGPGFTTDTTIVTAPAVTADGAAKFKITVTPASFTMVQYEFWEFRIKRGTTTIATHRWVAPSNALTSIPSFTVTDTPTAGSQTYSLSLVRVGGTGMATMTASATNPAEIIVEQIA